MRTLLVLLTPLALVAGCAGNGSRDGPQSISEFMAEFDEPAFDAEDALGGNSARYRLSITGINCREYVIRVDLARSGIVRGSASYRNKCGRTAGARSQVTFDDFRAREAEFVELVDAIRSAGLFQKPHEVWTLVDPQTICVDGNQLLFERLDQEGYVTSAANAQCGAPAGMIEAARIMIDMADAEEAEILLR
jgi:hypothetical protein